MKNKRAKAILLAAFFAVTTTACSSTETNLTINANTSAANSVANSSSNTVTESSPAPAANTQTAPDALVSDLYKQHDAKKSPFFQTKNRALVDKYFTKATADMIWKDAVDSKGEVGALGADPLYDAQDTDIKNFKVGKGVINGNSATVPATFENFGKKQTVNFALKQENNGWKIEDIKYGEYTLLGLLKENASAPSDSKSKNSSNEFEGKYQVGDTMATVKPIKMAFEVKWEKGSGTETFIWEGEANDKFIFASQPKTGKANVFSFDDENYNTGTFYRADGKEFPIKRAN